MKILLALIISFQFVAAPFAAELGEKGETTMKVVMVEKLSGVVANDFETRVRSSLKDFHKDGAEKFIKTNKIIIEGEDKKILHDMKKDFKRMPQFVEVKRGVWQAEVNKHKVSFSLADLYQDTIHINGVAFNFKDKSLMEIYKGIEGLVPVEKTTWYKTLLNNTLLIQEAEAALFIPALLLLAGVVFVAVWIKKAYNKHIVKPKEAAAKFNSLVGDLNAQANQCESAGNDSDAYYATFKNASDIGNSSKLKSMTSPSEALQLMIKGQVENGNFNSEECFGSLAKAGEKLGMAVPDVNSEMFKKRREILASGIGFVNPESNTDALIGLCSAYNRLASCMNRFVGAHVNGSEIEEFKDKANESFYEYKSSGGATKQ